MINRKYLISIYRDYDCNSITLKHLNSKVKLSGWIDTIRDHGNLIFIDLRDNYGITQCVIDSSNKLFDKINRLKNESVISVHGTILKRSEDTKNIKLKTGEIELSIESLEILSEANVLPLLVNSEVEYVEEIILKIY